jgi:hypothetical protein
MSDTIRIQYGAPEGATSNLVDDNRRFLPAEERASVRVAGGVTRVNTGGASDELNPGGVNRTNTYTLAAEMADGQGLEIRSQAGFPRTLANAAPGDLVRLPNGLETTIENAERLGYIQRNGNSGMIEKAPEVTRPDDTAEDGRGLDGAQAFANRVAEEVLTDIASKTMPGSQTAAVVDVIDKGEITEATIGRLATEYRVEPDVMRGMVSIVREEFVKTASRAMEEAGVPDPVEAANWLKANKPADYREAIQALTMQRDPSAFRRLGAIFMQNGISPADVLGADFGDGVTAHRDSTGRVVLSIPGKGQVAWTEAVRLGLVRVSRRG